MNFGELGKLLRKYNNQALMSPEEWEIEKINEVEAFHWAEDNFSAMIYLCVAYVFIVFGGQHYMEKRPRFDLRKPLLCWSALLAIFSIIGSIRCWTTFRLLYEEKGVRGIICSDLFYVRPVGRFWGLVFCISKAPELVDTIFIVLRKQKLIFLHWYHHITVLLFSWHCYIGQKAGGAVFMQMNFIVHSMMYSYYACRAARVRVPRFIALIITTSQIMQMVFGVSTFYLIFHWRNDEDCQTTEDHMWYGSLMYSSYLVLFCHFFYVAYIKSPDAKAADSKIKADENVKSFPVKEKVMEAAEFPNYPLANSKDAVRSRQNRSKAS